MLVIRNGTSSAIRHLRKDHKIDKKGKRILTKQTTITEAATAVTQTVAQVVTRFNASAFWYLFIRRIVAMHIALSCMESEAVRD
jgi:hypothetical protein